MRHWGILTELLLHACAYAAIGLLLYVLTQRDPLALACGVGLILGGTSAVLVGHLRRDMHASLTLKYQDRFAFLDAVHAGLKALGYKSHVETNHFMRYERSPDTAISIRIGDGAAVIEGRKEDLAELRQRLS